MIAMARRCWVCDQVRQISPCLFFGLMVVVLAADPAAQRTFIQRSHIYYLLVSGLLVFGLATVRPCSIVLERLSGLIAKVGQIDAQLATLAVWPVTKRVAQQLD